MPSTIVIIGPSDALPALRDRLDSGADLTSFSDAEALEALDHIIRYKPRIIALEHEFSTTSRGTALINRIKDDPSLTDCEVRVVAHDSTVNRVAVRRGHGPAVAVDEPKPALDQRGTRRAPRVRIAEGVEALVDGNAAGLVDLSVVGAQVLSSTVLKPNQRVRVSFSDGQGVIRCMGTIAWASFEMPKGRPTRYRAGIDLTSADAEALAAYAERHKRG
ncbi:MAG: PilZ domain-containing protein [Acidobacteriota bacterium]